MKARLIACYLALVAVVTSCASHSIPSSHASPDRPQPSPTSQAWGSCGNIRGPADARMLVTESEANALVTARIDGPLVRSYRVLAGQVSGLRALNDGLSAPRGKYLVLLGGSSPDYYVAFGYYGLYRIVGRSAYQMCAYGGPEVRRGGIADVGQIIALLRHALRR